MHLTLFAGLDSSFSDKSLDSPGGNSMNGKKKKKKRRHRYDALLITLLDFSLTVKAVTLMFISRRGSAISFAKQGKSGSIYNLVEN